MINLALVGILSVLAFCAGICFICIPTLGIAHNWAYFSQPENKPRLNRFLIYWLCSAILLVVPILILRFWPGFYELMNSKASEKAFGLTIVILYLSLVSIPLFRKS